VLGQGELSKAITVHAQKFSKSAQEKIEKAGGTIKVVSSQ
jgi:large subunit ribosomal protein L15